MAPARAENFWNRTEWLVRRVVLALADTCVHRCMGTDLHMYAYLDAVGSYRFVPSAFVLIGLLCMFYLSSAGCSL